MRSYYTHFHSFNYLIFMPKTNIWQHIFENTYFLPIDNLEIKIYEDNIRLNLVKTKIKQIPYNAAFSSGETGHQWKIWKDWTMYLIICIQPTTILCLNWRVQFSNWLLLLSCSAVPSLQSKYCICDVSFSSARDELITYSTVLSATVNLSAS